MPATSSGSGTPIRVVAPVPLNAQSSQVNLGQKRKKEIIIIIFQEPEESNIGNDSLTIPQLTVAMVVPRVESAAPSPVPGPSSTAGLANSSNTVTTTQAVKRPREFETDSTTSNEGDSDHIKLPQVI